MGERFREYQTMGYPGPMLYWRHQAMSSENSKWLLRPTGPLLFAPQQKRNCLSTIRHHPPREIQFFGAEKGGLPWAESMANELGCPALATVDRIVTREITLSMACWACKTLSTSQWNNKIKSNTAQRVRVCWIGTINRANEGKLLVSPQQVFETGVPLCWTTPSASRQFPLIVFSVELRNLPARSVLVVGLLFYIVWMSHHPTRLLDRLANDYVQWLVKSNYSTSNVIFNPTRTSLGVNVPKKDLSMLTSQERWTKLIDAPVSQN